MIRIAVPTRKGKYIVTDWNTLCGCAENRPRIAEPEEVENDPTLYPTEAGKELGQEQVYTICRMFQKYFPDDYILDGFRGSSRIYIPTLEALGEPDFAAAINI